MLLKRAPDCEDFAAGWNKGKQLVREQSSIGAMLCTTDGFKFRGSGAN
jgi:hypothetical protein